MLAYSTPWKSIYIAAMCSFVQSFQSNIFSASLWPYLKINDSKIDETFFGFIVASVSFGCFISAPIFGYWNSRTLQVKVPLATGLLCMIFGNLLYFFVELSVERKYVFLIARLMTGVGSGSAALLNAYVAHVSEFRDLARATALVTSGSTVGMVTGPAVQTIFTWLGYPGYNIWNTVHIHQYNAPALLAIIMNMLGLFLILFFLKEHPYRHSKESEPHCDSEGSGLSSEIYGVPILVCLLTRFTQVLVIVCYSTISSPYTMVMFGWSNEEAVLYNSQSSTLIGVIATLTYIMYYTVKQLRWNNHRLLCVVSLLSFFVYHVITYPYEFLDPGRNSKTATNISLPNCGEDAYTWCHDMPTVSIPRYFATYYVFVAVAFCVITISNSTIFAHLAGIKNQGVLQGVYQMTSSIASILGPLALGKSYTLYGPKAVWSLELAVTGACSIIWIALYQQMRSPLLEVSYTTETESVSDNK